MNKIKKSSFRSLLYNDTNRMENCRNLTTHTHARTPQGPLLALLEMVKLTVSSLAQEDARSLSSLLGDLFTLCLNHRAQHKQLVF